MALVRTNVTLPEELIQAIDELAGPRGRSAYLAEAASQKLKRDRLAKAIRETAGVMVGKRERMGADEIVDWVNQLRDEAGSDPWAEADRGR
jgi:metal-responsive CopG/Arc/MetJ family transcriptional regulator